MWHCGEQDNSIHPTTLTMPMNTMLATGGGACIPFDLPAGLSLLLLLLLPCAWLLLPCSSAAISARAPTTSTSPSCPCALMPSLLPPLLLLLMRPLALLLLPASP